MISKAIVDVTVIKGESLSQYFELFSLFGFFEVFPFRIMHHREIEDE